MRPRDEDRIRSEEELRARVRTELTGSKKSSKLWSFFNSSFGIWLLSTIVLGFFGWSYTQWRESVESAKQIQKIDIEIEARMEAAEDAVTNTIFGTPVTPVIPAKILSSPPTAENAIQAEFANRNLKSLLFDLQGRLPANESGEVMSALVDLKNIETNFNREISTERIGTFIEQLHLMRDRRWGWQDMMDRSLAIDNRPLKTIFVVANAFLVVVVVSVLFVWLHNRSRKKV